jgi:hypothetical protein
MSHDRRLIDSIKAHFARKSLAQLQEIVQAKNQNRWSAEAIAAAGEVLQERMAGSAPEPLTPDVERPLPSIHYDLDDVPLAVLGGLLTGSLFIPYTHVGPTADPDLPVPFGPKIAWLALDATDAEAVAAALGLRGGQAATWADGIDGAYQGSVFVTPPLADWTLAVGTGLFPPDRVEAFVKPLLERLSLQFGDAQYFCTHRDVELHVWARARKGKLVRGYGWLGDKGLTLWDEGRPTKEERELGFQFGGGQAQNINGALPDEGGVMQLASLWSIDPTTLDGQFKEPVLGLLGKVAGP